MNNLFQWLTILAAGAAIAIYGMYRDSKEHPKECPHPHDEQPTLSFGKNEEHDSEPIMTGTHR